MVDGKVKIKALQVETLSKALLKERQVAGPVDQEETAVQKGRGGVLVS